MVPLLWAEVDRQHAAESSAALSKAQRAGPYSVQEAWADGDRKYFAAVAVRAANEQRARPMDPQVPLSWAEADRQWHAERAKAKAVSAPTTKRGVSNDTKEASRLCRELRQLVKGAQADEADLATLAELVDDGVVASLAADGSL